VGGSPLNLNGVNWNCSSDQALHRLRDFDDEQEVINSFPNRQIRHFDI
jgi:hypothetical protein